VQASSRPRLCAPFGFKLLIRPTNTEICCPILSPFFWRKSGKPRTICGPDQ
jgi:hypothetical protein